MTISRTAHFILRCRGFARYHWKSRSQSRSRRTQRVWRSSRNLLLLEIPLASYSTIRRTDRLAALVALLAILAAACGSKPPPRSTQSSEFSSEIEVYPIEVIPPIAAPDHEG